MIGIFFSGISRRELKIAPINYQRKRTGLPVNVRTQTGPHPRYLCRDYPIGSYYVNLTSVWGQACLPAQAGMDISFG